MRNKVNGLNKIQPNGAATDSEPRGNENCDEVATDGGGFDITLDRTHVRDDDDNITELWKATVDNASGYDDMGGKTPGRALRALARKFDEVFGAEPRTDGGVREIAPEIEPEFVGAHSDATAETCELWTGDEPSPCDNDATHTVVHYDGKYHYLAACDDCGEPLDVTDHDRQWSTPRDSWPDSGLDDLKAASRIDAVAHSAEASLTDDELQKLSAVVEYLLGEEQTTATGGSNGSDK